MPRQNPEGRANAFFVEESTYRVVRQRFSIKRVDYATTKPIRKQVPHR